MKNFWPPARIPLAFGCVGRRKLGQCSSSLDDPSSSLEDTSPHLSTRRIIESLDNSSLFLGGELVVRSKVGGVQHHVIQRSESSTDLVTGASGPYSSLLPQDGGFGNLTRADEVVIDVWKREREISSGRPGASRGRR